MIKNLVVTSSVASHILNSPEILREFPAFQSLTAHYRVAPKRQCCGRRTSALSSALPAIKSTILSLPPQSLEKLKSMIKADRLILNFEVGGRAIRKEI